MTSAAAHPWRDVVMEEIAADTARACSACGRRRLQVMEQPMEAEVSGPSRFRCGKHDPELTATPLCDGAERPLVEATLAGDRRLEPDTCENTYRGHLTSV
ncbi:MAG: hypothetical protein WKF58_15985 [Ilumatobacteraceae bacterium]